MQIPPIGELVVVFVLSVIVLFIFHWIKAPAIVGFLLTGILAGPYGLGLIQAQDVISLADFGVILLLFAVGLEVSLKDLLAIKKYVLGGGSLQVVATVIAVFVVLRFWGLPAGESILLGFLISLSSTAIVLSILQNKAEFESPNGRTTLGMLIFQDIAIVPMMLITPMLPGAVDGTSESLLIILAKGLGLIVLVIISAKWIVPKALYQVARTGDRELFLLSIVAICLAVAWFASLAGLSLGLGAFLAGLTISESPYSHQAFGNVLPLRDVFSSFFFISIGMLLNVDFLLLNPGYIVFLALGIMILKSFIAGSVIMLLGLPIRIAVLVGLALSQIGEFSFVLSQVGMENGLLSNETYQIFLDVTVLTMAATSFIIATSPKVADAIMRLPLPKTWVSSSSSSEGADVKSLKDHLIIVGCGVNGQNVARSARNENIPYVIIDIDPEIFKAESGKGEPIHYGDATQEVVLQNAGVSTANTLVIAISDLMATRRITDLARRLNPDIYIIARTRYLQEMKPLHDLGANEVIPEEYETSIEIFSRILERYRIPRERIDQFTDLVRSDGYEMFRSLSNEPYCNSEIFVNRDIIMQKIGNESAAVGKSVGDIEFKDNGMTLIAINRGSETINNPDKSIRIQPDDVIVLLGDKSRFHSIEDLIGDR